MAGAWSFSVGSLPIQPGWPAASTKAMPMGISGWVSAGKASFAQVFSRVTGRVGGDGFGRPGDNDLSALRSGVGP